MNFKLIERLRNGEIAVKYVVGLEDLRNVLKAAFPYDATPNGNHTYYFKSYSSAWGCGDTTTLPSYSVSDFLLESEDSFPEKWCLLRTKSNAEIVNKWLNDTFYNGNERAFSDTSAYIYPDRSYGSSLIAGYTEITYEQFKKHVMKNQVTELPQYFAVKSDHSNPLWGKYIKWLNEKYGKCFGGFSWDYYGFAGTASCYDYICDFSNPVTILSLEEWDKIVNNKVLIGYKLIKPEYRVAANAVCRDTGTFIHMDDAILEPNYHIEAINKWRESNILDLWFEKVYETKTPVYKIDDWVTVISTETYQIQDLDPRGFIQLKALNDGSNWIAIKESDLRKATPEEIEKASIKLPTINKYDGKIDGDYILYGCAKFHKDFFINLQKVYASQSRKIDSIKLDSGVEITMEQINQIIKNLS